MLAVVVVLALFVAPTGGCVPCALIQCTLLVTQCADRIVFQANGLGRGLQRNVAHLPGNGFEQGLPAAKDGCAQTALKSYAFCTVLHTTKHGNATCQWHVHVVCFLCCFTCTPRGPSFAVDVVLSSCWMICQCQAERAHLHIQYSATNIETQQERQRYHDRCARGSASTSQGGKRISQGM